MLLEPAIKYDDLIHVMDAVRSADTSDSPGQRTTRVALFKNIAVGEAP